MPFDGLEALGWALATFIVSLLCGLYQAIYFTWFGILTDFQSAFVASVLFWATALGVPTWYQIYQNWIPIRIRQLQHNQQQLAEVMELIGAYNRIQNLRRLLPEEPEIPEQIVELPDEVPNLPRHEVPRMFMEPPPDPPHYLHHFIPDLDAEADLDPVPPYHAEEEVPLTPPRPVRMPTPDIEEVQAMYDAQEALAAAEAVAAEIQLDDLNVEEFDLLF
ncbi:hypothetical protein BKA82DRAFT_24021 [Pisolithus tinctorius]|uniref:Uncharacterized protein n=1 Tax=Pisolithus tinctorius Marx 270 TaxID=870435 RepID=A0A0C3P1C8_PISTI|nr:hypothetical protein BKA82DRAFT_24021 [Pisolithus tinctorius]KIO06850.1 hypothetical protein M404DRAFT_24021 [Pisolithus tinctorius Marx 270]